MITLIMIIHLRNPVNRHTRSFLLTWFMVFLTIFIGLMYFSSASMFKNQAIFEFFENPVLSIAVVFMLQFAYRFPVLAIRRRWGPYVVLVLSLVYALFEFIMAFDRLVRLGSGEVIYRQPWADYLLMILLGWLILVFVYRYTAITISSTLGLRHRFGELFKIQDPAVRDQWKPILFAFFRPKTPEVKALRMFIFTAMLIPGVTIWNLLSGLHIISKSLGSIGTSLGILLALFTFSTAYLNYQKDGISFMVKTAETGLVLFLLLLSGMAWVLAPAFQNRFQADLPNHLSLRFSPNEFNGYDIKSAPFSFANDIGVNELLGNSSTDSCKSIDFEFPLFGKKYKRVFACKDGILSLGKPLIYRNFQLNYGSGQPLILPLLINLAPADYPGSVYIQQQTDQLVITWMKQRAYYRPNAEFTFQLVLHSGGFFEINYRDLPAPEDPLMSYHAEDELGTAVWAVGVLPETNTGKQEPQLVDLGSSLPIRSGPSGALQDYSLEFRSLLNELYYPMSVMVILSSLLIALGFPLLIKINLVTPLKSLMSGVKQIDAGNLNVVVPISYNDEIGFLTEAFNKMALWMNSMVTELEQKVQERTSELKNTNEKLLSEMIALEEAQSKLMEQERKVAALAERERMARDLHDGLGQVMASINMQTQAARSFLELDEKQSADTSLKSVIDLSSDANTNIRRYILGLHDNALNAKNLVETLQGYLGSFSNESGIRAYLDWPADTSPAVFPAAVEEQLLHIIQEALTNTRKHAEAKRVEVIFSFDPRLAQVIISDDGCGFETDQLVNDENLHFGLGMMKERALIFGGRLEIRSLPGQGTKIVIFIPLITKQEQDVKEGAAIQGMRILLVDDSPIFLEGVRSLLMSRGLIVVGTARDGLQALEKARQLHPDVIVMDVNMPVCSGLEALRMIKPEMPEIKIIMLTINEDEQVLFDAIKSGASGYLLKNLDANEFCSLLSGLAQGQAPLTPVLAARLLVEFSKKAPASSNPVTSRSSDQELTIRQGQILELLAGNLSYKEIAQTLDLQEGTVKYHMGQILEKLHLLNRADAVAYSKRLRRKK